MGSKLIVSEIVSILRNPSIKKVLTFNSPNFTTVAKIGFMQVKVDVYIPNPLRCYNCQVFGHHENKCGRHPVCCNCGEPEHCGPSCVCDKPAKCPRESLPPCHGGAHFTQGTILIVILVSRMC